MEAAGVGLGAVSLIFQIFAGCIKGYQLLSEAQGLEKDHQFFRIRFKTEQYRLLDWATTSCLSETDDTLIINKTSRTVLLDVLDQQYRLMFRFGRYDDRLKPLAQPLLCEEYEGTNPSNAASNGNSKSIQDRFPHTNVLLNKSLDFIRKTSKFPTRLRWAISDKAKIEDILVRLTALNDYLNELLNAQQLESLNTQQTRTNYQIMQLNNKMDHLCDLVSAGLFTLPLVTDPMAARIEDTRRENHLAKLAQFKALMSAIDTSTLTDDVRSKLRLSSPRSPTKSLYLSSSEVEIIEMAAPSQTRVSALYKPSDASWSKVWIEWKPTTLSGSQSFPSGTVDHQKALLARFEALVQLLRQDDAVRQFHTLRCLGYHVQDLRSGPRFGLVFENPRGVDPALKPFSLLDLLSSVRMPSLSARVKIMRRLAESLEKLHAVNWLHKGIRSQNVLFFRDYYDASDAELENPYLSGFDYARPDAASYMSESPPAVIEEDLYRHPAVQGGPREDDSYGPGFRKQHDIYALGLVLLEIACWEPIWKILGFGGVQFVRPRDVAGVKQRLLEEGYGSSIRRFMGDTVTEIVLNCIKGPAAFGVVEGGGRGDHAVELQQRFSESIVMKLQQVRI